MYLMRLGQKLCPMCTRYTDQADDLCPHCGYNFETGEAGEAAEIPMLSDEPEGEEDAEDSASPSIPEIPAPERTRSGVRTLIALVVIIGLAAPILVALPIQEAIRSLRGSGAEDQARNVGPPDRAATRSCVDSMNLHMGILLADAGRGRGPVQSALLDAANELGVTSFEYETLLRLYGEEGLLSMATRKGSEPALRRARKLIRKECRRHYR
jgi:hypothetical protein